MYGGSLLPPAILGPVQRQPRATGSLCTEVDESIYSPPLLSPTLLSPDYIPKMPFRFSGGLFGTRDDTIGEVTMEN